jgi:O-antigen/teichoic acid export membrane protein
VIELKRVYNNAILSVSQVLISAVVLFFLYRYILDQLGPKQLGVWSVVLASVSVARLTDMGLSAAVVRQVAQHLAIADVSKAVRTVQTAVSSIGVALTVVLGAAYPIARYFLSLAMHKPELSEAIAILPWAMLSLWFGLTGAVIQSALDASRLMHVRNIVIIVCNFVYIAMVIGMVPRQGLAGLAQAQAAQSMCIFVGSWIFLRRRLPGMAPFGWHKAEFREMLGYALHFQIAGVIGLMLEPITKFFLSRYGDVSLVAYYEMAAQVVAKARALTIAAFQAVLPEIASISDANVLAQAGAYRQSHGALLFVAVPMYLNLTLAFPAISIIWIGHVQSSFVIFGQILGIGALLGTLGVAAYFMNLGAGKLRANTACQVFMGACNLIFGWACGYLWGGSAVVLAAVASHILAQFGLLSSVRKRLGLTFGDILPAAHRVTFVWLMLGALASEAMRWGLTHERASLAGVVAPPLFFAAITVAALARHPFSHAFRRRFRSSARLARGSEAL